MSDTELELKAHAWAEKICDPAVYDSPSGLKPNRDTIIRILKTGYMAGYLAGHTAGQAAVGRIDSDREEIRL